MGLVERLDQAGVIVSTGTGGVGKTTVSAALGALMARRGKKVLVLTIDPARRLAQALGLEGSVFEAVKVGDVPGDGELFASMVDPQRIFDRFVERFSPRQEVTEKLKGNRLYQQLVTALTGSQEFTSMDRLLTEVEQGGYDLVILDTPPTQNAVDFLKAPQRVVGLFDERITKWFIRDGRQVNFISKVLSRGTKTALAALEKVTGSEFIGELSDFFEQMSFLQGSVKERSQRVERLLKKESTLFFIVAGADEQKMCEAKDFAEDLNEGGFHMNAVLLNRVFPKWFTHDQEMTSESAFFNEAVAYYREQLGRIHHFESSNPSLSLFKIPESPRPLNGIKDIVELSRALEDL